MPIFTISTEQTKEMLIHVADAIVENKPLLTEIDSKIGDGDHGIGMAGGLNKGKSALLAKSDFVSVNDVFKTVGMAMISSMGGASGVIFGTMFLAGAKVPASDTLDGPMLASIMTQALDDIKKAGKAEPGDKTMVDALSPAVGALNAARAEDLEVMLDAACKAAEDGVEKTKGYIAKFGRAKSLMERAVGFQDAGATSVAIIFGAMRKYVSSLS